MCLKTIVPSRMPIALAAVTYSISRWARICARTRRQVGTQESTPSTTMIRYMRCVGSSLVPMTAERIIANGMNGRPPTISAIRMMMMSRWPPKYPARPPKSTPRMVAMTTEIAPTVIVTRPPLTMRVSMSRPRLSVPSVKPLRPQV